MDAQYWIEESVKSKRETLDAFLQKQMFITDVRSETWSYKPPAHSGPVALEKMREWKIGKATGKTQRTENFKRFLPFANAVEICTATISGRPEVEILDLSPMLIWFLNNFTLKDANYRLYKETVTLPGRRLPDT